MPELRSTNWRLGALCNTADSAFECIRTTVRQLPHHRHRHDQQPGSAIAQTSNLHMRLGEEIDMQTNAEEGSTGPATQTTDQLESKSDAPHLWNPTSAANSSLVLSQAFGAYLHAANWRVLGKPERAAANMRWFWATIVLLVMNAVLACFPAGNQIRQGLVFLAAVGLFFGWYFTEAKSQIRYVNETFGEKYIKKGRLLPDLAGLAILASYLTTLYLLGAAFYRPDPNQLTETVKLLILQEWRKNPDTRDATIEHLTLAHERGNTYNGVIDASLDGDSTRLFLEVTADGRNIIWRIEDRTP